MDSHQEKSLTNEASPRRTICEVHREMFDLVSNAKMTATDKKMILLISEAFGMAKRMDAKLKEYKHDWDSGLYETNENYRQDRERRRLRLEGQPINS